MELPFSINKTTDTPERTRSWAPPPPARSARWYPPRPRKLSYFAHAVQVNHATALFLLFQLDAFAGVAQIGRVFARIGKMVVIAALIGTLGIHWLVLQSIAWSGMLARNLQRAPLAQAVQQTFDGQHPCTLCQTIATGKQTEQRGETPPQLQKLEFPRFVAEVILPVPPRADAPMTSLLGFAYRPQAPPLPPPRHLTA